MADGVQVGACEASYGCCEGELADAQGHGEDAFHFNGDGVFLEM